MVGTIRCRISVRVVTAIRMPASGRKYAHTTPEPVPVDDGYVIHCRHRWGNQNIAPAMTAIEQQAVTSPAYQLCLLGPPTGHSTYAELLCSHPALVAERRDLQTMQPSDGDLPKLYGRPHL